MNTVASPETLLCLHGTLRRHGANIFLEQIPPRDEGERTQWMTARLFGVLSTAATQDAVVHNIGRLVTVTGKPEYITERHQMLIVLDSVESLHAGLTTH
jgi:hypothetical protein